MFPVDIHKDNPMYPVDFGTSPVDFGTGPGDFTMALLFGILALLNKNEDHPCQGIHLWHGAECC